MYMYMRWYVHATLTVFNTCIDKFKCHECNKINKQQQDKQHSVQQARCDIDKYTHKNMLKIKHLIHIVFSMYTCKDIVDTVHGKY